MHELAWRPAAISEGMTPAEPLQVCGSQVGLRRAARIGPHARQAAGVAPRAYPCRAGLCVTRTIPAMVISPGRPA